MNEEPNLIVFGPHFPSQNGNSVADVALVGGKAAGLAGLPLEWVPPYLVLSTVLFHRWRQVLLSSGTDSARAEVQVVAPLLSNAWPHLETSQSNVLVRSSAAEETLRDRGRYESAIAARQIDSLLDCAHSLWIRHVDDGSRRDCALPLALLVQPYMPPHLSGHLSNERRVSREAKSWLIEFDAGTGLGGSLHRIRSRRAGHDLPGGPLLSTTEEELIKRLRAVAGFIRRSECRSHLEWLWDGNRVWIVQCDREVVPQDSAPGSLWMARPSGVTAADPSVLVPGLRAQSRWRKIDCLRTFAACNLPIGEVFVIESTRTIEELAHGYVPTDLERDLRALMDYPIVIRTDISADQQQFLLPRTDCVMDLGAAKQFLINAAARFAQQGLASNQFCFILHRFIAATAAAQAISWPWIPRVRIDATWGFPDGLQFFPHDSYEVDAFGAGTVHTQIRGKTDYLDVNEAGTWIVRRAGTQWDWRSTLTDEQARWIARATYKIACQVSSPVDVMYFVNLATLKEPGGVLPWFISTEGIQRPDADLDESRFVGRRVTVSNMGDVQRIARRADAGEFGRNICLRVVPDAEVVRSTQFLSELGDLARSRQWSVELLGSVLSHAYYLLKRSGVRIRCSSERISHHRRQKFGKLVRDYIPIRIKGAGEQPHVIRVHRSALERALREKAIEEAKELEMAGDVVAAREELADLVEVVRTLAEMYGGSLNDIVEVADGKRRDRGGFSQGFYLVETDYAPLLSGRAAEQQSLFDTDISIGEAPAGTIEVKCTREGARAGGEVAEPTLQADSNHEMNGLLDSLLGAAPGTEVTVVRSGCRLSIRVCGSSKEGPGQLSLFDGFGGQ